MKQQNVAARLAALEAEVDRRKAIQEEPEDPLSQSMREYYQELAALDELGKAALLEELNRGDPLAGEQGLQLTPEAVDKMVENAASLTFQAKLICRI